MAKAKLTVAGDVIVVETPYNRSFVAQLKSAIPSQARSWNDDTKDPPKVWLVGASYLDVLRPLVEHIYGECEVVEEDASSSTPKVEKLKFQVRYIGAARDRGDGEEPKSFGLVRNNWTLVIPESVLRFYFEGVNTVSGQGKANYFAVLNLRNWHPTQEELKSAYRRMARQWHPDVCKEPNATEMFQNINLAYETLKDPNKAQLYKFGLTQEESLTHGKDRQQYYGLQGEYKPPLRCGWIYVEGTYTLGGSRFSVQKIHKWDDIVDERGRTLVSSWNTFTNEPDEVWVESSFYG